MYNPPNYNSNANFNKFKGTYFNNDVDISGGHLILRNGSNFYMPYNGNIFSFNNRIEFNDISNNIYFHTPLKMFYNSIEYDIGQKLGQIQDLYNKIGTMTYSNGSNNFDNIYSSGAINFLDISGIKTNIIPIVNSNTQKLTNITFSGPNTTNFTGVLNFVSGQISVGAINGTAVNLNGEQTITATKKTFQNNLQLNGSLLVGTNGNVTITNANLQAIPTTTTKCTNISYANVGGLQSTTITNSLISQTFSFTNTINNINTTTFGYLSGVTSSIQAQINNISGVSLSNNNIFTGLNTFNGTTTTIANTLATTNITFSGTLNNINTTVYGYLSGVTSSIQTQLNNLSTSLSTTTTNANDALQRVSDIEFSDIGGNQTTISNKCVLGEVQFTTDLNDVTPTTFGYLQGVTSSIQTQLDSKLTVIPGTIFQHIGGTLQEFFPYRYLLCNGQSVSRTEYAILYQWIGTSFGSGDGSTTFNVPNYTACFLRMTGERVVNGVIYTPNAPNTIQQDSLEAHVHSSGLSGNYLRSGTSLNSGYFPGTNKPNQSDFPSWTGGVSSSHRTAPETRPLNHSVYFYITC